jgi:hypothetical protein
MYIKVRISMHEEGHALQLFLTTAAAVAVSLAQKHATHLVHTDNTLRKGTHFQQLSKWDSVRTHVRHNSNIGYQVATSPLSMSARSKKTSQCVPILRSREPSATRLAASTHAPKEVEEGAIGVDDKDSDGMQPDVDVVASVVCNGLQMGACDAGVSATTVEIAVAGVKSAVAVVVSAAELVDDDDEKDATCCTSAKSA